MPKENKQLVFVVITDKDGNADKSFACSIKGGLSGTVSKVEYITDSRVPFEPKATLKLHAGDSETPFLEAELNDRQIWLIDGPKMSGEPVRCVVTGGGKGRGGSFVVTCN